MSTLPSPTTGSAAGLISEKEFQATVIEYAKACGWKVYHTYDSRRSDPGSLTWCWFAIGNWLLWN